MKNNSALISTAMLSAIFEESRKDSISLLIPFVTKIISEENTADESIIVEKMERIYSFNNFPHAIVKVIIKRMKKKEIIKQENGKYIFLKDMTNNIKEFDTRHENSKKQIDEIIKNLMEYIKKNSSIRLSYMECRNSFAKFLDENGYLLYEDIESSNRINKNIDSITYHIGRFICEHKEKKDVLYDYLINVIEGALLANALYVNIDNDNHADLKKLNCFFDTPFMLRILEFKLPEENNSALELFNLLKKLNVKIKCFKHNYEEIENILEEFIRNYGKISEKTLENLILKNYSKTSVQNLLNSLDTLFSNLGIEVVDVPEYNKSIYAHIIDEQKLAENLLRVYKDKKNSIKKIENDVKSISAIMRLREGKEFRKLEDCNAIFVTTNKYIRNETNKLLNMNSTFKISPVISDIDLTAIVWLKSLVNNKNLPEMKLTENAMAASKPTAKLRKKFSQELLTLKSSKANVTPETLYNLLCSSYFSENLMLETNGDTKKINLNVILNTYETTLKQNHLLNEKEQMLNKEKENLAFKLLEKEQNDKKYKNNIYKKYKQKENKIINFIKIFEKIIKITVCLALFFISYKYTNDGTPNIFLSGLIYMVSIYALLSTFIPISIFQGFNYLFNGINDIIFVKVNKYYTHVAEKEIERILDTK